LVTLRIEVCGLGVGSFADGDVVADGDVLGADEDVLDEKPEDPLPFRGGGGVGGVSELAQESLEVFGSLP
jgi:hypothetical protein